MWKDFSVAVSVRCSKHSNSEWIYNNIKYTKTKGGHIVVQKKLLFCSIFSFVLYAITIIRMHFQAFGMSCGLYGSIHNPSENCLDISAPLSENVWEIKRIVIIIDSIPKLNFKIRWIWKTKNEKKTNYNEILSKKCEFKRKKSTGCKVNVHSHLMWTKSSSIIIQSKSGKEHQSSMIHFVRLSCHHLSCSLPFKRIN